jgi:hypothetical protein
MRHAQVAGGMKFKPPISDINAPDLYIPLMGFLPYCVLCCLVDVVSVPSRFKPEVRALRGPRAPWCGGADALSTRRGLGVSRGGAALRGEARSCFCGQG